MSPYIVGRGEAIITDQTILKDPIEFTAKLLEFKKEMEEMVSFSFQNDIACYCDNELKKGLKGATEAEIE